MVVVMVGLIYPSYNAHFNMQGLNFGQPFPGSGQTHRLIGDARVSGSGPAHVASAWYSQLVATDVAIQIGVGHGIATKVLATNFKTVHIFDFADKVEAVLQMIQAANATGEYGTVIAHPNTYKTHDTYTWSLKQLLSSPSPPIVDYAFFDGAHEWHLDGFSFFLVDKMLRVRGIIEFDGINWTVEDSGLRLHNFQRFEEYEPSQRTHAQVKDIVEVLVLGSERYEVVEPQGQRIFRKLKDLRSCCKAFENDKDLDDNLRWHTSRRNSAVEIGIDKGQTTGKLVQDFKTVHTFDFFDRVALVRSKLSGQNSSGQFGTIVTHGSSYNPTDSYTYTILRDWLRAPVAARPVLDYVYLDAAHEWHHDGFMFFLIDSLLPVGGIFEFDDWDWSIAKSPSVNPKKHPDVLKRFTQEQIASMQVSEVLDILVKTDGRYKTVVQNRVYRKISANSGECCTHESGDA